MFDSNIRLFPEIESGATKVFEKFLADSAPHGTVKQLRNGNGGEFISGKFEQLLVKNTIAFQSSAPNSPHQNGNAERGWRSIFDTARCLLIKVESTFQIAYTGITKCTSF